MRYLLLTWTLILATLFAPVAWAQSNAEGTDTAPTSEPAAEPAEPRGELFDQKHRRSIYEARKLSYGTAAAWSLALPGLGNFYVEQYLLGGLAIISMVFAGFFLGFGVANDQTDLTIIGAGLGLVTYGWSITSSMLGVTAYNETLRKNLHLTDERTSALRGPGLALTFTW